MLRKRSNWGQQQSATTQEATNCSVFRSRATAFSDAYLYGNDIPGTFPLGFGPAAITQITPGPLDRFIARYNKAAISHRIRHDRFHTPSTIATRRWLVPKRQSSSDPAMSTFHPSNCYKNGFSRVMNRRHECSSRRSCSNTTRDEARWAANRRAR